jgi:hypothetical protein
MLDNWQRARTINDYIFCLIFVGKEKRRKKQNKTTNTILKKGDKTKSKQQNKKIKTNVIKQNKQTKQKYHCKSNEVKKTEKIIKKKGKNGKTKIIYNNKYIYNYFVVDEYFMSIVRLLWYIY